MTEFPDMKGFSPTNLHYIRGFYNFYNQLLPFFEQVAQKTLPDAEKAIIEQVAQKTDLYANENNERKTSNLLPKEIFCIPWCHHIILMRRCKTPQEALFYVRKTIEGNWSRSILLNMLDTGLYEASGQAITNFTSTLPLPQSDLAQQTLKDPYIFDFLALRRNYDERELENALTNNITKFLLELGTGFAYVGRQFRIQVGEEEFFLDLLFYHLKLRCFVVVELKTVKFEPSHLGQLGFYVTAVNEQLRNPTDNETIGLLICKTKDKVVARQWMKVSICRTCPPRKVSSIAEFGKTLKHRFAHSRYQRKISS